MHAVSIKKEWYNAIQDSKSTEVSEKMANDNNKPMETPERVIWANAVLKDGKLLFWWTGDECHSVDDFYKDFFHAGLDMLKELDSGIYTLEKQVVPSFEEDVAFYNQFELHEDYKGMKPGESPFKPGDVLSFTEVVYEEEKDVSEISH